MKIFNITQIFDNGEFVTIVTETGSAVHLPMNDKHSITVTQTNFDKKGRFVSVDCQVDLCQGE